jgi:hypothetical protein
MAKGPISVDQRLKAVDRSRILRISRSIRIRVNSCLNPVVGQLLTHYPKSGSGFQALPDRKVL